jgi:hypothetical protein
MGGEEVVHHHHHQMVDMEVLQKRVGLGHGCDVVVGDAVPHHCVAGVGEVAHYLHLTPRGDHVDGETHGGDGGHGVGVHLDHENGTVTIMVMWEMTSTILLWRSTDGPGGVGNLWMVHMEKLSFLIENRLNVTVSLTLSRMLCLGLVVMDNVWISLVC